MTCRDKRHIALDHLQAAMLLMRHDRLAVFLIEMAELEVAGTAVDEMRAPEPTTIRAAALLRERSARV